MRTLAVAHNTFREAIRSRILYTVMFCACLLLGVSTLYGSVSVSNAGEVARDFGLFMLSIFGAVMTMILGVAFLDKEIRLKTIYNVLSKPLTRTEFIFGKFLGLAGAVSVLVAVLGIAVFGLISAIEGAFVWSTFQGVCAAMLESVVLAGVVTMFSAIVVTPTLTGLFTLGTYMAGHSIEYLIRFAGQYMPDSQLGGFLTCIGMILPDLSLFNISADFVYGKQLSPSDAFLLLGYAASYSVTLVIIAALAFRRREFI